MNRKQTDDASSSTSNSDLNQPNSKRQPPMSHSASSSADPEGCAYEVFLSFRGSDTRKGFTDHLYTSLVSAGIRAFRDDEDLRVGEEIGGNLLEATNQSKIFIPIFSKYYASSKWCLKEAAHMVKCKNSRNHLVLPIFYDVTPGQVKDQSGTYEEAFVLHSKHYDEKTVGEWREALKEIGAMKGWESQNVANGHEGELVQKVVAEVWRKLQKGCLFVKDPIISMEDNVDEVMGMLQIGSTDDVRAVGIYGIGGVGKTTLAKIIYNQLLEHFKYSSFIKDIREMPSQPRGLEKLQSQLVSDILKSTDLQTEFASVDRGMEVLSKRLQHKKVLILLDDVDNKDQIDALANLNWFARGSRVIITTRNKDVLDASGVKKTYELRPMNRDDALNLFSKHAFKEGLREVDYVDLTGKIVKTTGGLPLALEIIGSYLSTKKCREVWEDTLKKLENCPYEDVQKKLWISYEALDPEQKEIFLDIACFLIGADITTATYMWESSCFYPKKGVEVLTQRCLIKVGDDNKLWMHDQLRDLGREIVRCGSLSKPSERKMIKPSERSRVWSSEDVKLVLEDQEEEQGAPKIEAIQFGDGINSKDYHFTGERHVKLPNVRFLRLASDEFASLIECRRKLTWLKWCHNTDMDCNISMRNLVILDLSYSCTVTNDWSGWSSTQLGKELKVLILESCQKLLKTPDLSKFPKLERLSFKGCESLSEVDPSIGELKNLICLDLRDCYHLKGLPKELNDLQSLVELYIDGYGGRLPNLEGLKKLEFLSANGCKKLNRIPQFIGRLTSLVEISLDDSGVRVLPDSFKTLAKLERLSLRHCPLEKLPDSIGGLISLKELFLSRSKIQALPESIGNLTNLQVLLVDETQILNLPSTLGKLEKLEIIDASNCQSLQGEISVDLWKLCCLKTLKLNQCDMLLTLPQLPTSLQCLTVTCKPMKTFPNLSIHKNLLELTLEGCIALERIPGLGNLVLLKTLKVSECRNLTELNGLEELECLRKLRISSCDSLEKLSGPLKSKQLKTLEVFGCESLQAIPNLSDNKMLHELNLHDCKELRTVEGVGELELLESLVLSGCGAIESLPNLSKLAKLKNLALRSCAKLRELPGWEELKSLGWVDISFCTSLYYYAEEWPDIPWDIMTDGVGVRPICLFRWKLFLSYRGQDVSHDGYVYAYFYCDWRAFGNVKKASKDWGAFRDEGEPSGVRLEAMNRSKIYIPILSKGYAFSFRCLQELVHILECKKKGNRLIFPIFYDVSPDQVQKQSGSYGEAFEQHINRYEDKIVEKWRATLREVGALNGWELQHVVDEHKPELVGEVLHNVLEDMERKYKVGIEVHVEEVMKMLEINANNVRKVGIHGVSGIGKTTLAKGIYDQLKEEFAYHIFLTNIRETSLLTRGPEELQSQPLPNTLIPNNRTNFEFSCLGEGSNVLRHLDEKVLIVVDDVDQRDQLEALVPNNGSFVPGTKIVITTTKKEALDLYQVQGNYELKEMGQSDALVLFYEHAFSFYGWSDPSPSSKLIKLSRELVLLIGGFPLALKVMGSFLRGKDEKWWEDMLKDLKEARCDGIQSKLRIVYEKLENEAQEAFLDIACFFVGTHESIASRLLGGDNPIRKEETIGRLRSLSLVEVLDNNELWMHDQLRDLGREIVQQQRRNAPDKRIRLLHSKEAIQLLNGKQEEKNTERITVICLGEGTRSESDCFSSNQFTLLPNLEFLQLNKANIAGDFNSLLSNLKYLRWHHCPNNLSATNLCLKGLLVLEITESDITDDWNGWSFIQMSVNLEVLILKSCWRVTKTPYLSTFPKLHTLIFDDCKSLNSVDSSIGELTGLQILSLKGCSGLEVLDVTTVQNVEYIEHLSLKSFKSLKELPSFIREFYWLRELDLSHTSINGLPDSLGELSWLEVLNMSASNIEYLPSTVGKLEMLQVIDVSYCRNLNGEIILEPMRLYSLRDFIMDGTNITLPPSIIGLLHLRRLNWAGCYRRREIDVLEDESDDGYGDESNDEPDDDEADDVYGDESDEDESDDEPDDDESVDE